MKVKICGVRTREIVDTAVDAGADYVGLVFFPNSPRYIAPDAARHLAELASGRIETVAVLVDPDDALVDEIVATARPSLLQLHGSESPDRVAAVKARSGLRVIKAVGVATADDVGKAAAYRGIADMILFDAKAPAGSNLPGGHGLAFDWRALGGPSVERPFALSGGLDPDNVWEALTVTGASMVDVSSGVERAPGEKDPDLVRRFIQAAKARKPAQEGCWLMSAPLKQPPLNSYRTGPDERGHFGLYGGRFVAETLMPLILDLERAYNEAKADPSFQAEMDRHLATYVGRPSPLYFAERLTQHCGGAKIYFKREELNHTGAHKVNNVLGQIMLAMRMGKTRIIAETGAGMHGVATATLCAKFGLPCIVYMGSVDVERQKPNVLRMKILGAEVRAVESGSKTLKDAMNEALRDWVANVHDTFYCIGTVAGPHPYPAMVRDFQSIIGRETREQMLAAENRLPIR